MPPRTPAADWVELAELDRDPHPTLARLRATAPVCWVPALNGWVVTTRDLALAAMRDDVRLTVDDPRFTTGQITGPSMLSTDGAEHTRHRAPVARPFRLDAIRERFTTEAAAEVERLIGTFARAGEVELRTQLAGPLAARMMILALGFATAAEADTLSWYTSQCRRTASTRTPRSPTRCMPRSTRRIPTPRCWRPHWATPPR
jgi:cytochrome P450